jgi:hypothetical protein
MGGVPTSTRKLGGGSTTILIVQARPPAIALILLTLA